MNTNLEEFLEAYKGRYIVVADAETKLIDKDKSVYATPPEFVLGVVYTETSADGYPREYDEYFSVWETKDKSFTIPFSHVFCTAMEYGINCIVVGHNVCFDMLVSGVEKLYTTNKDFIWDTAIAEYEMYAQTFTYPSLQSLADKYCPGEHKEGAVSEMIKAGVCPSTIPRKDLEAYCLQDVILTHKIFHAQMKTFLEYPKNLQNLILQRMQYRMITHEMSCNGMMMDKEKMLGASRSLEVDETILEGKLTIGMASHMPNADEVNPNSNQQLMGVLYGIGTYKITKMVDTGEVYKSGDKKGQPKLKKDVVHLPYKNPLFPVGLMSSVDEQSLNKILSCLISPECKNFVETLLKYRTVSKERRTYFQGYYEVARDGDPYISLHTEFKHTATPTGRISSSKPNIQNLKSD